MLSQLEILLKGKKTYLVVIAAVILGILEGYDILEVSTPMWVVIGALGAGSIRSAVNTIEKAIEDLRKKGK